jgi:hypothetical protein
VTLFSALKLGGWIAKLGGEIDFSFKNGTMLSVCRVPGACHSRQKLENVEATQQRRGAFRPFPNLLPTTSH